MFTLLTNEKIELFLSQDFVNCQAVFEEISYSVLGYYSTEDFEKRSASCKRDVGYEMIFTCVHEFGRG